MLPQVLIQDSLEGFCTAPTVMLSEAKHPASIAVKARSFAKTLRMTSSKCGNILSKGTSIVKGKREKGCYVAFKSFDSTTMVASGATPLMAKKRALAADVKDPVIVFIPKKSRIHIYFR